MAAMKPRRLSSSSPRRGNRDLFNLRGGVVVGREIFSIFEASSPCFQRQMIHGSIESSELTTDRFSWRCLASSE
jgi:hypothetical protein